MKVLILLRRKGDKVGKSVINIKQKLEKDGHKVDIASREDDLGVFSFIGSAEPLRKFVEKIDKKEHYDIIYTQDWSLAFPFLFPKRIMKKEHYCLFHDLEPAGAQSKILQKIAGNMLGEHLIVKTERLKKIFSKATFSPDGNILKI